MDIKVGFSKPNKWKPFSWLIMIGYNIPFDHVYISWNSKKLDRDIVYQASSTMVNFMGSVFFKNNIVVDEFQIKLSDENYKKMVQFAIDTAGEPYGIKECFGLAYVRICELLGFKVKNPFNADGTTYVCSELVGYILQEYANLKIDNDLADITPLEVYNCLKSININNL